MPSIQSLNERLSERSVLMRRMLDHMDIDLIQASHAALGTGMGRAARQCMLCRETEQCRAYLDGKPKPGFETPARFCPNAYLFAAMARTAA